MQTIAIENENYDLKPSIIFLLLKTCFYHDKYWIQTITDMTDEICIVTASTYL